MIKKEKTQLQKVNYFVKIVSDNQGTENLMEIHKDLVKLKKRYPMLPLAVSYTMVKDNRVKFKTWVPTWLKKLLTE